MLSSVPLFPLQRSMRKQNRSPRKSGSAAKTPGEKAGNQPLRKLTASDDLGVLFSQDQENDLPHSFVSALATGIPATTLAEILTKNEKPPWSSPAKGPTRRKAPYSKTLSRPGSRS